MLGGDPQTTPLYWAANHNQIYAVELLLRHGADASFIDKYGYCVFLNAIRRCFPIMGAYLVAKGTNIDCRVQDDVQLTALMILCQPKQFHLDSFRMVLSLQADVNAQDRHGNTVMHHAVYSDLGMAVKMLLDNGALPNIRNKEGNTALEVAQQCLAPRSLARHLLEEDEYLSNMSVRLHIPVSLHLHR